MTDSLNKYILEWTDDNGENYKQMGFASRLNQNDVEDLIEDQKEAWGKSLEENLSVIEFDVGYLDLNFIYNVDYAIWHLDDYFDTLVCVTRGLTF